MGVPMSRMSGHMQTTTELLLIAEQPYTYHPFEKIFEEDPIQDVRKKDIFDCISKKIRNLQEILSGFCKCVRDNERDIAKDPHMKELVGEFIDMSLDTIKFYHGLAESVSMEKSKQDIIEKELQNVAPGSTRLSETQLNKVKEKFMDFLNDEDPFKDLHLQYEPLLKRYEQSRKNLEEKIEKLGIKRKADRAWNIVSRTIFAVVTAVAAVICVIVAVVAPAAAPAVATAISLYATSMGILGQKILEESKIKEEEELAEKIKKHTSVAAIELKQITSSVDGGLNCFRAPIVLYVQRYLKDHDILDLADIAIEIKKLQEPLLQNLDDLRKDVDRCLEELKEQIKDLKQTAL